MKKRHCGVELGRILEGLRPFDGPGMVMMHAIEEILRGGLRYEALRDDGSAAVRYCMLALGVLGEDIYYASLDGPKGLRGTSDLPIGMLRASVATLRDGRGGTGQIAKVIASPQGTVGVLIAAESADGKLNCGFAWNPALARAEAERVIKAYFTKLLTEWAGSN